MLFLAGSFAAYLMFGHVRERVDVWLHPFADANGTGYQIVQTLYGLADGGILGSGIAQGHPDLVPYANSDFIIATVGELLGSPGSWRMLVLYAILVARGLQASLQVRDPFGRLLAFGLAFVMGLQVFVVVGGVTKLIPLTGLTTPFLSRAARRSSPTGCSSRCCCGSATPRGDRCRRAAGRTDRSGAAATRTV